VRTRHPVNEAVDAIRLVDVTRAELEDGVNHAECWESHYDGDAVRAAVELAAHPH
jgi:hypothetical protein